MKELSPEERSILELSARKDISFSNAELKFLKQNINTVDKMGRDGLIEKGYDGRELRYIIILEKGRDLLYEMESEAGFAAGNLRV